MKRLLVLLTILTIIFLNSGQTYEEQSLIPTLENALPEKPFETVLSHLQIPYWGQIVSIEERGYYAFVEFLIRKGAHVISFGILALAFYWAIPLKSHRSILAFIMTITYAVLDEFHQSTVSGRTAYIGDIGLDAVGAVLALTTFYIIRKKTASRP